MIRPKLPTTPFLDRGTKEGVLTHHPGSWAPQLLSSCRQSTQNVVFRVPQRRFWALMSMRRALEYPLRVQREVVGVTQHVPVNSLQ